MVRFADNPRKYLQVTLDFGVLFPINIGLGRVLLGYSNVYWCGDRMDRRSTTSYVDLKLTTKVCNSKIKLLFQRASKYHILS